MQPPDPPTKPTPWAPLWRWQEWLYLMHVWLGAIKECPRCRGCLPVELFDEEDICLPCQREVRGRRADPMLDAGTRRRPGPSRRLA